MLLAVTTIIGLSLTTYTNLQW